MIVTVPDAEALHASFAAGLREAYGRLPVAGIPRLLRPRREQGTATGFSVVDVGGNWPRVYRAGGPGEDGTGRVSGLARVLEVAARQGDARGDEDAALAVLDRGLARHPDAHPVDRARALLYRAELLLRLGQPVEAATTYALARELLVDQDGSRVADELAHVQELLAPAEG